MRMLEAARRAWNDAGRPPADLRYETFGSSGLMPTAEFRVRLKDSDTELVVPQNSSMLDVLNDAGFEVMSDCQRGECGVCAIDVVAVDGEIDHRDVFFSDHQKQDNRKICPCVSRAMRRRHRRYAVPAGSGAVVKRISMRVAKTLSTRTVSLAAAASGLSG